MGAAGAFALVGAMGGCISAPAAAQFSASGLDGADLADRYLGETASIDEALEAKILGGRDEPGKLVELSPGLPGAATRVTVHGINASPDKMVAIHSKAITDGERVLTFAYDDRHRRLKKTSADLAAALEQELAGRKGLVIIDAHSMGGRIAVATLSHLQTRGTLPDGVQLNLIAPTLEGYASANWAWLSPPGLAKVIGGIAPGRDMGTSSGFQKRLERISLPTVTTKIYVGSHDDIAPHDGERFQKVAEHLNATKIVLEGEDHNSVIDRLVADRAQQP